MIAIILRFSVRNIKKKALCGRLVLEKEKKYLVCLYDFLRSKVNSVII